MLTPILLHHLGKSTYGLWVVASGAVAYLELFELGFGGATTKLIAEDATVRPEQALRTLNTTFFVLRPAGAPGLGGRSGPRVRLPAHRARTGPTSTEVIVVVVILAFGAWPTSIPGDTFGGALVGHQRYDLLALVQRLDDVATAAVSIVVVVTGGGIVAPGGRHHGGVDRVPPRALHDGAVDHAGHTHQPASGGPKPSGATRCNLSGWFLLQAVLAAVYATGDVMTVGIVLGLRDAAIYAVGSKLAGAAINGLDAMAQVFFPHASAAARNQKRRCWRRSPSRGPASRWWPA